MKGKVKAAIGLLMGIFSLWHQPVTADFYPNSYEFLGGIVESDPSCAVYGDGRAVCAVKGTDNALYVNLYDDLYVGGGGWSGWQLPGRYMTSNPNCGSPISGSGAG